MLKNFGFGVGSSVGGVVGIDDVNVGAGKIEVDSVVDMVSVGEVGDAREGRRKIVGGETVEVF